jgi:hypothetical protein
MIEIVFKKTKNEKNICPNLSRNQNTQTLKEKELDHDRRNK